MITVTTSSGLVMKVDERRFNDFRVMRAYTKAFGKDKSDMERVDGITDLVQYVLGDKEDELFAYVADDTGYVDSTKVFNEMSDILDAMAESQPSGELKNS